MPGRRISHFLAVASLALLAFGGAQAESPAPNGALPVAPAFSERPATREILQRLRHGGYVLYLRHGYTDNSRADRMPSVDLKDCSTQRPLTEGGRNLAAGIGEAMRKAGIPVGELRISPLCRVRDTAAAAFPDLMATIDQNLMYTANLTSAQKAPILANTRRLLSLPVPPGSNRLLVAHAPNLMDLIGYFPKEGTLVIFQPKGEGKDERKAAGKESSGFEYIASIPPALWSELLR